MVITFTKVQIMGGLDETVANCQNCPNLVQLFGAACTYIVTVQAIRFRDVNEMR